MNFPQGRYTANWFVSPKAGLKLLGIKATLHREDWQILKQYPFGELAYDYEEGLKFSGEFKQLAQLVVFMKKVHSDNHISFRQPVGKGKNAQEINIFQVSCSSSDEVKPFKRACKKTELVLDGGYGWPNYTLVDEVAVIPEPKEKKVRKEQVKVAKGETRKERVEDFFNTMEKTMVSLYHRWQDESEYEDINEYGKFVHAQIVAQLGGNLVKMSKRPFGFTFEVEGAMYQITINGRQYGYKLINTPEQTFQNWLNKNK
jgi:hypothetical protein